jgi:glycosyl hydrolase family 113
VKRNSYRVYILSLILMLSGVFFQAVLIGGHIPFFHLSSLRPRSPAVVAYETQVAERDLNTHSEVRMHRPTFQTGMIFPQWGTNAYDTTDASWPVGLNDIQTQTEAQWIEMPINFYQSSVSSTQVTTTSITPTPEAMTAGIRAARARHFHVFVVPLLSAGGTLTWSGSIQFFDPQLLQAWFDSYWQVLEPYAIAAVQAGAEQFAIGTEFEKLQYIQASYWNQLIERVHLAFPGRLTYDINWSSLYNPIPAWMSNSLLTTIGVSEYIPLTNTQQRLDPSVLPSLWETKVGKLLDALAQKIGHPVFISEIGYRDSAYALYRPWQRDVIAQAEPPDTQEQAAAYDAALKDVLTDQNITGIYFWAWSVPLFQPNWKPAAKVLFKWYTSAYA